MKREFRFLKYQACGNDFILRDERSDAPTPDTERGIIAKMLCSRNFQVGADGLLFVESAEGADGSMRLFEPDGKEADMCGNGLRCVAAHLMSDLGREMVNVLTRDGVKRVTRVGESYRVDMGPVRSSAEDLEGYLSTRADGEERPAKVVLDVGGRQIEGHMVNTGEPHVVVFTSNLDGEDVQEVGARIGRDLSKFPKATNVDFVQVSGPNEIRLRTYERGVFGETLACGTGATASAAVSIMLGLVRQGPVTVEVRGGQMIVEVDERMRAFMTGPAVLVFEGTLMIDL